MITTDATVWEVCMVKGGRAREMSEVEDKGKREKRQAAADRAKKNQNGNDEGDSGGEEEDAVAPSSGKRGHEGKSKQPSASTLAGPRGPVVDFSWRYLPPPFSLGQMF